MHVYMDKNYSSPHLYFTLAGKRIGTCGTLRPNRKHFPNELITKATASNGNKYDYRSNGSVLALVSVDQWSI